LAVADRLAFPHDVLAGQRANLNSRAAIRDKQSLTYGGTPGIRRQHNSSFANLSYALGSGQDAPGGSKDRDAH
jgi:hypothetical protein